MDRLAARWQGKLEAEAAAAEYRRGKNTPSHTAPKPQVGPSTAWNWEDVYQEFKAMADEEARVAPGNQGDRWLRGYVDYQDSKLECGDWRLSGGITETFKARFAVVAMNAAHALQLVHPEGHHFHLWLHQVFQFLLRQKSNLLQATYETRGFIKSVCQGSALYCQHLQVQAAGKRSAVELARSQRFNQPRSAPSSRTREGLRRSSRRDSHNPAQAHP